MSGLTDVVKRDYDPFVHLGVRTILRLLIVSVLTAVMVWPASGQVLCIGGNGHVAVEIAHPDAGCDDIRLIPSTNDDITSVAAESSGCTDLAILSGLICQLNQKREQAGVGLAFTPALCLIDCNCFNSSPPIAESLCGQGPAGSQRLNVLRSTILLI